jgi:hypothetical protein
MHNEMYQHVPMRRWSSRAICWLRPNRFNVTSEMQHERTECLRVRHVAVSAAAVAASSGRAAVNMAVITPGGMSARPAQDRRIVCIALADQAPASEWNLLSGCTPSPATNTTTAC